MPPDQEPQEPSPEATDVRSDRGGGARRRELTPTLRASALLLAIVLLGALIVAARRGSGQNAASPSPVQLMGRGVGDEGFERVTGPEPVVFPEDEGPHPSYRTEWWYYTGNLEGADSRRYGFQLTFFRNALAPPAGGAERASAWATRQAYLGHFALTDVSARRFQSFERLSREALGLAGARSEPFRVWVESWSAEDLGEGPGAVVLEAVEGDTAIHLELRPSKPAVLHGDRGYSAKGDQPGNASTYYSFTRLEATGSVTTASGRDDVSGSAWMDHEWSTSALDAETQVGWDWFSLQLDDGTELMLFEIRERDGGTSPQSSGSFVDEAAEVRHVEHGEFEVEVLDHWRSPRTGASYPSRWRVKVPGERLEVDVTPVQPDQELSTFIRYWEGAVDVSGSRDGRPVGGGGYVELTGYAGEDSVRGR